MFKLLLFLFFWLFVFAYDAHAYLDPGSGSLLIQLMIGTVLGGLYFAKLYWSKITKFILSFLKGNINGKKKPTKTK